MNIRLFLGMGGDRSSLLRAQGCEDLWHGFAVAIPDTLPARAWGASPYTLGGRAKEMTKSSPRA